MALKKLDSLIPEKLRIQANLLDKMTDCARLGLPAALAEHCWVGGFDKNRVHLITDQQMFAEPIYFAQYEVIKRLNDAFSMELEVHFKKVRVHIADSR